QRPPGALQRVLRPGDPTRASRGGLLRRHPPAHLAIVDVWDTRIRGALVEVDEGAVGLVDLYVVSAGDQVQQQAAADGDTDAQFGRVGGHSDFLRGLGRVGE